MVFILLAFGQVGSNSRKLRWAAGYWYSPPAWGGLPAGDIDYSALTHVIHAGPRPNPDGTLDKEFLKYVYDYAPELIRTAHRNGVKVLLCIGQPNTGNGYVEATRPKNLNKLVANIMELVSTFGYDGVDLDWETGVQAEQFIDLVRLLRSRLDARSPRGELTGAFWEATWYLVKVKDAFDQINVMAYDECSPEEGFSWHNSALYGGWYPKRRTVNWRVRLFTAVIPPDKLGLGIPFYGYEWTGGTGTPTGGVTAPGQSWATAPQMRTSNYRDLITNPELWQETYKRRDGPAGNVPFLSIDSPGSSEDKFVTYEDPVSIAEKVRYAKSRRMGGIMIWELSADYLAQQNPKHPLLEAVKTEMGTRRIWGKTELASPDGLTGTQEPHDSTSDAAR